MVPNRDCSRCARLAAFRDRNRRAEPAWHNAPVPSFGPLDARLLVVGLAPGLNGANRTGRPFTGDYAGDLLYATLLRHGLAVGSYRQSADDGLELRDCRITNAVRCVPPANKPLPDEMTSCRNFLEWEMAQMEQLRAILALGKIAHDQVLRTLGLPLRHAPFEHGRQHRLPNGVVLTDSYHCSRYNTNTGRLTAAMFDDAVRKCRDSAFSHADV